MTIHPAARDSEGAQTDSASLASAIHTLCDHGLAHEALQVARYLVVKSPDLAIVQTAYGRALFETGETMTASDVLSRAAVQFPYAVAAHRWLAECLLHQGGTARARAVIEKALGLAPDNPRIRELANLTHVLDNAPLAPGAWLQDVMEDDETTARIFSLQTRARIDVRPPLGHDDPTVVGAASAQSSYISPRSARNPRPKTAEFYGVDDPSQTDELPAIPEPRRKLAAIWQAETSTPERVWRTRSLLILGALAIGVCWALWLARQSPTANVVEKTVAFPTAPIAPRVQATVSIPTSPTSVTSGDRDRLATEARQQGERTKALQLARQSIDGGTATSETGLLLANLGEIASARIVLNTLSADADSNLDWLRFAVDLGAGAPTSTMPNHADTPEATLVAARASLRAGGPKALSRFLDGLQP
jgi:tetratricopeptide (TPR) repeat protein